MDVGCEQILLFHYFVSRLYNYLSHTFFFIQVKLLQSLGLKSTLITDGSSPINLFTTANGLLGALQGKDKDE